MNREQAQAEYLDLLNRKLDEEKKIIEDAKQKGIWRDGLDSNRNSLQSWMPNLQRK